MTRDPPNYWTYRAKTDGGPKSATVDGDTLDLVVDLGFGTLQRVRVRLLGVDTAEIYGVSRDSPTYQDGLTHQTFVQKWLADAQLGADSFPLTVETKDTGKYGRWLATVRAPLREHSLNEDLRLAFPEVNELEGTDV